MRTPPSLTVPHLFLALIHSPCLPPDPYLLLPHSHGTLGALLVLRVWDLDDHF